MPKSWFQVAMLNFFFAACLGLLLRYAFVEEIAWLDYRNAMHGHSHVAMLGWIYMAIFGFLVSIVLNPSDERKRFYSKLYWVTQASVIGMLVAFPIFGYTTISIVFSTLHIICSYFFVAAFWKDFPKGKNTWGALFIKSSLVFLVLSTIAIWSLIPVIISGSKGSALYYALIQFFLHFQFNGWFIFSLLGILFWYLEKNCSISFNSIKPFYGFLIAGTILTYVLAVTWSTPLKVLFYINSFGVVIQLIALYFFISWMKSNYQKFKFSFSGLPSFLLIIAIASFILKVLAQSVLILPSIAEIAYTIRNFVIGFLHLILLGLVSTFLLFFASLFKKVKIDKIFKIGIGIFISGIFGSETLLFAQGAMFWQALGFMPYYYEIIFAISICIPLGIMVIFTRLSSSADKVH